MHSCAAYSDPFFAFPLRAMLARCVVAVGLEQVATASSAIRPWHAAAGRRVPLLLLCPSLIECCVATHLAVPLLLAAWLLSCSCCVVLCRSPQIDVARRRQRRLLKLGSERPRTHGTIGHKQTRLKAKVSHTPGVSRTAVLCPWLEEQQGKLAAGQQNPSHGSIRVVYPSFRRSVDLTILFAPSSSLIRSD